MYNEKYLYENGLPFNGRVGEFLDLGLERINNKKATVIIIDGNSGEGKTTLAVQAAAYCQGYYKEFDESKWVEYKFQFAMGGKEFKIKLKVCVKENKIVLIYDEAGDFSNRNFSTQFNKMLDRIFETYRTFKILVMIVLPLMSDLDNGIFKKGVPRLLLHCHGRGKNYGNISIYGLNRMFYIKDKIKKLVVPPAAYVFTLPNSRARFKNLPPDKEKELDVICSKGKLKELDAKLIQDDGLIDYETIAARVHKSIDWVKRKVNQLHLTEHTIFNRKKFFKKNVVDIILKEEKNK